MKKLGLILIFLIVTILQIPAQDRPKPNKNGGGVCNSSAVYLPAPELSEQLKEKVGKTSVYIRIIIDKEGNVTSAEAVTGNPLLHEEAEKAALKTKFKITTLSGKPVEVRCEIVYNFGSSKNDFFGNKIVEDSTAPIISLGKLNNNAKILPMPQVRQDLISRIDSRFDAYVRVRINLQTGKIVSAIDVSSNKGLFSQRAIEAAKEAMFEPILTEFSTVYGTGILSYKFSDINKETIYNDNPKSFLIIKKEKLLNDATRFIPEVAVPKNTNCAGGDVEVLVLVDIDGKVISAKAVSGNPQLYEYVEEKALEVKFSSISITPPVYAVGKILFRFPLKKCISSVSVDKRVLTISHFPPNTEPIFEPKLKYPEAAGIINVSGKVIVEILVDETGGVEEAKVISGHPLLRAESLQAAKLTKFKPFSLGGIPVKARGILTYNFNPKFTANAFAKTK